MLSFLLFFSVSESNFCVKEAGSVSECPEGFEIVETKEILDQKTKEITKFSIFLINEGSSQITFSTNDYIDKEVSFCGAEKTIFNINFNSISCLKAPKMVEIKNTKVLISMEYNQISLNEAFFENVKFSKKTTNSTILSLNKLTTDYESLSVFLIINAAAFHKINKNSILQKNLILNCNIEPVDITIDTSSPEINITQRTSSTEIQYSKNTYLTMNFVKKGKIVYNISDSVINIASDSNFKNNEYMVSELDVTNCVINNLKSSKMHYFDMIIRENCTINTDNFSLPVMLIPASDFTLRCNTSNIFVYGMTINGKTMNFDASGNENCVVYLDACDMYQTTSIAKSDTLVNLSFFVQKMNVTTESEVVFKEHIFINEKIHLKSGNITFNSVALKQDTKFISSLNFEKCGTFFCMNNITETPILTLDYTGGSHFDQRIIDANLGRLFPIFVANLKIRDMFKFTAKSYMRLSEINKCFFKTNLLNNEIWTCCAEFKYAPNTDELRVCYAESEDDCNGKYWVNPTNLSKWTQLIDENITAVTFSFAVGMLKKDAICIDNLPHKLNLMLRSEISQVQYPLVRLSITEKSKEFVKKLSAMSLKLDFVSPTNYSIIDFDEVSIKRHVFFGSGVLHNYDFSKVKDLEVDVSLIGFLPLPKLLGIKIFLSNTKKILFIRGGWEFYDESDEIISSVTLTSYCSIKFISPVLNSASDFLVFTIADKVIETMLKKIDLTVEGTGKLRVNFGPEWNKVYAIVVSIQCAQLRVYSKSTSIPIDIHNTKVVSFLDFIPTDQVSVSSMTNDDIITTIFVKGNITTNIMISSLKLSGNSGVCFDPYFFTDNVKFNAKTLFIEDDSTITLKNIIVKNYIYIYQNSTVKITDVDLSSCMLFVTLTLGEETSTIIDTDGKYKVTYPRVFKLDFIQSNKTSYDGRDYLIVTPRSKTDAAIWRNLIQVTPREIVANGKTLYAQTSNELHLSVAYKENVPDTQKQAKENVVFATIITFASFALIFAVIALIITRKRLKEKRERNGIGLSSDPLASVY